MSHIGRAHTLSIDEDEDGFTITLEGVDDLDGIVRVNIQDVAEQLYDQARARIGPWLEERDSARLAFLCEHGALNPDHPDWGERLRDAIDLSRKYQREHPS